MQHEIFEEPFLQDVALDPLELDFTPGFIPEASNPCIFQLGYSFYDFTPFKVYVPSLSAQWKNPDNRKDVRTIVYSWCQPLDSIPQDDPYAPIACDQQDIFAGIIKGKASAISPDDTCFGLSNGSISSIDAINIYQQVPLVSSLLPSHFNTTAEAEQSMQELVGIGPDVDKRPRDGIALVFSNGEVCDDDEGTVANFTINMFCNPDYADNEYMYDGKAYGTPCNPVVDMISK